MLRSLRAQLVFSHILPLLVATPLLYFALSYLIESRLLIPTLSQNLASDARLLTEITRRTYLLTGDLSAARFPLAEMDIDPQMRLVFLNDRGEIAYSNDPAFSQRLGEQVDLSGVDEVWSGQDVVQTEYSYIPGGRYLIQVFSPVRGFGQDVVGVLWLTYYDTALERLFELMRWITIAVTLGSMLAGGAVGLVIGWRIARPVRQAAQAIDQLAHGDALQPLEEGGPQEIHELTRAVNVLVARLYSLEQARRQLLANLVHELGRPLGALRAAIQALGRGAAEEPQFLAELTAGMDGEAARMQDILEELTHLHDQVLGSLELKREPTSLSEWLPRVLLPWQEAALEKGIEWKTEIPPNLPVVAADQNRLAQVIGNLASNAIKYTPSGGSVCIEAGRDDQQAWMRFRDTGPGIPVDEQGKIFLPFFRGSQGPRIKDGMGLGLSIARDLARAHAGEINVQSKVGEGSTFELRLPLTGMDDVAPE